MSSEGLARSVGRDASCRLVVVEVGAGIAVPTIRFECEGQVSRHAGHATLVRINLEQPEVPAARSDSSRSMPTREYIGVGGLGALEAIRKLDAMVKAKRA